MTTYNPMTTLPAAAGYAKGDVLVLLGELFGRGYANGIIDEARAAGLTIIGTTVGRRESDGTLRGLTAEELTAAEENLGGKIVNIPLEAGFDMEPASDGKSFADLLKALKPDDWASFNWEQGRLVEVRAKGRARFTANLAAVVTELNALIPAGARVIFVHSMAGGIPRARVFMPLLNRVFKGQGDKYLASRDFWSSALGKLCQASFDEVTADTFNYLIESTAEIRAGHDTRYAAYGYHGCAVLIDGAYTWQSYTPYLQGWAKVRLEDHAAAAREQGVKATVYNCPEIQTNSSALFLGVEISLYPLLAALVREGDGPVAEAIRAECRVLLKDDTSLDLLLERANEYLAAPFQVGLRDIAGWPHHNSLEQAEAMLTRSAELMGMNANPKEIVCAPLSRAVFSAVGRLMFADSWQQKSPVVWLSHDIIARQLLA
ncbi:enoyl ACP reductase FabMG family protein [Geobacter argillaceus]|uniref:Uncharacterized protein n=1 Tax=Geobacter argillaceus TaxID=345631 RepID=A0A562VNC2_9BACT|nr:hypothetical protein [Geobacter argillaceus]TWJ19227.1 hypothetical protein JN12_01918 [Geobacter argillaceus]